MKLIRKLGTRLDKKGNLQSWAIFWCDFCLQEVVRQLNAGRVSASCGCNRNKKHMETKTKLYIVWSSMKQRCLNIKSKAYKDYGGRGITICPEWANDYTVFRDWSLANGYKEGLEIDREDNNGNYEPSNCRWVIRQINGQNTRHCKINLDIAKEIRILYKTENYTKKRLMSKYSLSYSIINKVIKNERWFEE